MRAPSARSAVLAVAVALALATGGLAYGSSADDDDSSTRGAQTAPPAAAGAAPVPETTNIQPKQGSKPSKTVPKGSTRDPSPADRKVKPTTVVDKSDKGAKKVRVRRDRGKKNLPATTDLGDR